MALIMQASRALPVKSRDRFLRLVSEQVKPRGIDLNSAIQRALNFLRQQDDRVA
jgi:hypothetical protein